MKEAFPSDVTTVPSDSVNLEMNEKYEVYDSPFDLQEGDLSPYRISAQAENANPESMLGEVQQEDVVELRLRLEEMQRQMASMRTEMAVMTEQDEGPPLYSAVFAVYGRNEGRSTNEMRREY